MPNAVRRAIAIVLASCFIQVVSAFSYAGEGALPRIGIAPAFELTNQDGRRFSLSEARGKVAIVTFIFTTCSDTCPLLTAKLIGIHRKLGADKEQVVVAAITVDPLQDTPATLKKYAQAHGADPGSFVFLTGSIPQIEAVSKRYAVFRKTNDKGGMDHTFLTSLVDRKGVLRVQYIGTRFDPDEFKRDVKALLAEPGA